MPARDRASSEPAPSTESQMTFSEFIKIFPDHDACLDYLKKRFYPDDTRCPKCERKSKFHRIKGRSAYGCQFCGHQVYPTADTIFHKSTVSLQLWFWAIYLMSSTRCGISAKQLEREIGVTYKTAHRMFKLIRSMLSDDESQLSGEVEIDEMYVGGSRKYGKGRKPARPKTPVLGMVERGGRVSAQVVSDKSALALYPWIRKSVAKGSQIFTDEHPAYVALAKSGFVHDLITHKEGIYVSGNVHTQTIDGFWALVKNGIQGVYHSVSVEYLQSYLDEYAFRFNRRDGVEPLFWAILGRVRKQAA